ncbi:MAG: hypothetical protein ACREUC_23130, partial [Steroidobacteraceae bacterium]
MKCLLAVSVLSVTALTTHLRADAAEGRLEEAAPVVIDQSRMSVYSGAPASAASAEGTGASKPAEAGARRHKANGGKT